MKCPKCGEELNERAQFCPMRGTKVERKRLCSKCGEELDERARFCDCKSLEHISIPDSVTYIGAMAFDGCDNLKTVTVPANVKIDKTAFTNCGNLEIIHR